MDKMREEFEAWVSSKNLEISFGNYLDDEYDSTWTQVYWEGWQASRKALVVELPDMIEVWNEDAKHYSRAYLKDGVEFALNQNGINYK